MSDTKHRAAAAGDGTFDVAIVGGGFAGLSAAYPLVRARRPTILFHTGETRNRFADASHNWIALDGAAPAAVHRTGTKELERYPDFTRLTARIVTARRVGDADGLGPAPVELTTASGERYRARRVILATGMRDAFPQAVAGLEACWGVSVLQCPYCHGYEHRDVPTGLLHGGPPSLHQAKILPDFSADLVYFANGAAIEEADRAALEGLGYRIEDRVVERVVHDGGRMTAVVLADGAEIARDALYVVSRAGFASDLHAQLGCAETEGPVGPFVTVDDFQKTSACGVFAAGDMTRPVFNAVWAGADGNRAGVFAHRSLLSARDARSGPRP